MGCCGARSGNLNFWVPWRSMEPFHYKKTGGFVVGCLVQLDPYNYVSTARNPASRARGAASFAWHRSECRRKVRVWGFRGIGSALNPKL